MKIIQLPVHFGSRDRVISAFREQKKLFLTYFFGNVGSLFQLGSRVQVIFPTWGLVFEWQWLSSFRDKLFKI